MSNTRRDNLWAKAKLDLHLGVDNSDNPVFQRRHKRNKGGGFLACSCLQCKAAMHESKQVKKVIKSKIRSHRHNVKLALTGGDYDVNFKPKFGYIA